MEESSLYASYKIEKENSSSEFEVPAGDVYALAWRQKPKHMDDNSSTVNNTSSPLEYRKFYVLSRHAQIHEYSFGDQSQNVFDFSSRGQLCLIQADKMSACTANLLDQNLNFDSINQGVVHQFAAAENNNNEELMENERAAQYRIEQNAANSSEILDISRLMMHRLNAGYLVDQASYNAHLSARFMSCQSQYS